MSNLNTNLPRTRSLLEAGIEKGLHPGAQIYVSLNSEALVDEGIGESRPGVAMDKDAITLWMSATKPVTSVLFAQAWERDEVALDTRVAEVIPEFASHGKADVTFQHILTHTGGFRVEPSDLDTLDWSSTVAQICAAPLEPGWLPGEKAGYHPVTSWYVLAEAVSRITRSPFPELVQTQIFDPLRMDDTWVGIPEPTHFSYGDRVAWMYNTFNGSIPDDSLNSAEAAARVHPGGNGRGPIRELGRFYEMLLKEGEGLMEPETVALFTSPHRKGMFDETFQHKIDWGLGFIVDSNHHGHETVPYGFGRHATLSTFGHGGSQSSAAFADPAHNLVVAVVCNGMPGEPRHNRRARDLHSAIYEDLGITSEVGK